MKKYKLINIDGQNYIVSDEQVSRSIEWPRVSGEPVCHEFYYSKGAVNPGQPKPKRLKRIEFKNVQ